MISSALALLQQHLDWALDNNSQQVSLPLSLAMALRDDLTALECRVNELDRAIIYRDIQTDLIRGDSYY
jgi:hypothetical protein